MYEERRTMTFTEHDQNFMVGFIRSCHEMAQKKDEPTKIKTEVFHMDNNLANILSTGARANGFRTSCLLASRFVTDNKYSWNSRQKKEDMIKNALNSEVFRDLIHTIDPSAEPEDDTIWNEFQQEHVHTTVSTSFVGTKVIANILSRDRDTVKGYDKHFTNGKVFNVAKTPGNFSEKTSIPYLDYVCIGAIKNEFKYHNSSPTMKANQMAEDFVQRKFIDEKQVQDVAKILLEIGAADSDEKFEPALVELRAIFYKKG